MQASECSYNTKYPKSPNGITDPEYSIDVGIQYLKECLELAGVKDVLAKSLGASNAINVAKATFAAIDSLTTREAVYAKRGIAMPEKAPVETENN